MYYFINKETRKLIIAIVYINDVSFIGSKNFLLLSKLKQKFMIKWKCYDFKETKKFLEMYINCNYKNQNIFIDQFKYLNKVLACFNIVTNLTSTPLLLGYMFKLNNKQCDHSFY